MAVTLLIIGVTCFLVGSLGLIIRFRERGKASLSVCLPLASVVPARECWPDVRFFVLARLLGLALVGAGLGVAVARDPLILEQPQRIWGVQNKPFIAGSKQAEVNRFVNASDAILRAIRHDSAEELSGSIHGDSFHYDRVELIEGMLSARQGSGFLPELEVRVFFDSDIDGTQLDKRKSISVRPGDPVAPVVHLSWRDQDDQLQTEIIRRGYHMELQLAPLDRNQLKGFLQLILPDATRSFLSGEFVAYTNHLRYKSNGKVDLGYTHPDTLEHVARRYIINQYPSGAVERIRFGNTVIKGSRTEGSTVARVRLEGDSLERKEVALQFSHGEWVVRREAVTTEVVKGEARTKDQQTGNERDDEPAVEAKASGSGQPRGVSFADLSEYVGERLRTERHDGKLQKGTLKKVEEGRMELETSLSGGTVRYHVKKDQLRRARLSDGTVLVLDSGQPDRQSDQESKKQSRKTDDSAQAPAEKTDANAAQARGQSRMEALRALEGRRVRITNRDGKSRTGKLASVAEDSITLTVSMAGGSVDYYYQPSEIEEFEAVSAP